LKKFSDVSIFVRAGLPVFLLVTLLALMFSHPLGFAQEGNPILSVEPSLTKKGPNPPPVLDTDFSVNVEIRNVSESHKLVNVTFTLAFNSTLLQVLNATEGRFMRSAGLIGGKERNVTFNYIPLDDRVTVSYSIKPPYPPPIAPQYGSQYPYGQGVIAKVFFRIKYQGESGDEDTSFLNLQDIGLKNDAGGSVPFVSRNGSVKIYGLVHPEISVINPLSGNTSFVFLSNTLFKGSRFNATLMAIDVADLFAWQVKLYYNTSQLVATKISIPTKDPSYVFNGRQNFPVTLNGTDFVQLADTILSGATFNGTGKLGIVEFKILEEPPTGGSLSSNLSIDNDDTYILDSNNQEVASTKTNGYYQYVWAESLPTLEVKPSKYTTVKPETFNMTIWLNNISADKELVSVEFKLRYNVTLLNSVQVLDGPFLAGFGFTFDYSFSVGSVALKHFMNPPYYDFPFGSGQIATITFEGMYQDSSVNNSSLEFVDVILKHANGTSMLIAPPLNGVYSILPIGSSIVTIEVIPASVESGSNITISGSVKANETKADVDVEISYRLQGGVWSELATTKTNSFSNYTYTWTTTVDGTFEIKTSWAGDEETNPAESEIKTVTVLPKSSSSIDFTLIIMLGAGIIAIIVIAMAVYFLKIRGH